VAIKSGKRAEFDKGQTKLAGHWRVQSGRFDSYREGVQFIFLTEY